jgi:phospholipase/carboxylesterase
VLRRDGELAGVPYLEVVLGDQEPCSEMPLVVILHGLGDRPDVPRWPYGDLPVSVRMVLPHGPVPWGDGYAWSSVRTLDHEPEGLAATMDAQSTRIAGLLDALTSTFSVFGGVILTGFSQGAILALTVTMQHPEHLALVMPLAGWAPPALRTTAPAHAPPIRWLHGLEDDRVPYAMAIEAATDLRQRGYDVELIAYQGEGHHMSHAMDERFHSWLSRALDNAVHRSPIAEGFLLVP